MLLNIELERFRLTLSSSIASDWMFLWWIPSKHSSWWRRLEDVFPLRLQKTSSRRLEDVYDEYVRLSLTSSEDTFKTSWSRHIYSSWPYVFKTSSRRLAKMSSRRFQDVFKTSWRRLEEAFKAFWKRLQDIFKSFLRRIIKSKCSW